MYGERIKTLYLFILSQTCVVHTYVRANPDLSIALSFSYLQLTTTAQFGRRKCHLEKINKAGEHTSAFGLGCCLWCLLLRTKLEHFSLWNIFYTSHM